MNALPRRRPAPFGLPSLEEGLANERKFAGDALLVPETLRVLDALCLPDGEHPDGLIRSIYFDSPDLSSYAEKANGDNLKTKVRIRWYEEASLPDGTPVPVFLELKERVGASRRKARFRATAPAGLLRAAPFDGPELPALLARLAREGGLPVPAGWIPTVLVAYRRTRFVCPSSGSRIAMDRDVEAPRFNPVLFPAARPVRLDTALVEWKNADGRPPPWSEALFRLGYRLRSFSKYATCIDRLRNGT